MSQVLSAAALTVVLAVCWALGRPRPRLLRSEDGSAVAALNRAQIALLQPKGAAVRAGTESLAASSAADPLPLLPVAGRERQRVLLQWRGSLRGDQEERRRVVRSLAASGDAAVLPLLRQALRDPDPQVVHGAAQALEAWRRRPPGPAMLVPGRPQAPRNVARMR